MKPKMTLSILPPKHHFGAKTVITAVAKK